MKLKIGKLQSFDFHVTMNNQKLTINKIVFVDNKTVEPYNGIVGPFVLNKKI